MTRRGFFAALASVVGLAALPFEKVVSLWNRGKRVQLHGLRLQRYIRIDRVDIVTFPNGHSFEPPAWKMIPPYKG